MVLLAHIVHALEIEPSLLPNRAFGIVLPHDRQLDLSLDNFYRKCLIVRVLVTLAFRCRV